MVTLSSVFFLSEPFPNSPLKALEDKKQGWNYAEVLHMEAGLQDKSLQSQQVRESLIFEGAIFLYGTTRFIVQFVALI